jgi:minor extracellular serine protease Vpr
VKNRILISTVAIVFLLTLLITPVSAMDARNYIDVVVELDGFCVTDFTPKNYVKKHVQTLDSGVELSTHGIINSVKTFVHKNNSQFDVVYHEYGALLRGFSCRIESDRINKISNIPGVKRVYEIPEYKLYLHDSVSMIKGDRVWEMKDEKERDITGHGTIIGIIDSGLDYRNTDLGGEIGVGKKVIEGYDFADDLDIARDGQNHGTHVAGICSANGKLKGVAPSANLIGFKVFSSEGKRTSVGANIIKALEQALLSKCTVVNMSLGSMGTAVGTDKDSIYHNAVEAGMTICAASGNNGARAPGRGFPIGYPSSIDPIISVAATDDALKMMGNIIEPEDENFEFVVSLLNDSPDWIEGEYEIVDCGYGNSDEDFAELDLEGKVALIKRGPVSEEKAYFRYKDVRAGKAGAVACIIYNHSFGSYNGTLTSPVESENMGEDSEIIPASSLSLLQGEKLLKLLSKGKCVIKIKEGKITDRMAYFSSSGPSSIIQFKPDVSAPGVHILSTMNTIGDNHTSNWGYKNGTSMACPHVAGAVALISQAHPLATPAEIKSRLMATADLLWNDVANEYVPLSMQGSGRIDIEKAIETKIVFDPPGGSTKANTHGRATLDFVVQNLSAESQDVKLTYKSIGWDTEGEFEFERLTIKPFGQIESSIDIKCMAGIEGILEGVIFASIGEEIIHLPLIVLNQNTYLPPQLSYLRAEKNNLINLNDENPETVLTFKLNYGSFMTSPDSPSDFITSTISALYLSAANKKNMELGVILYDDIFQAGYYHIPWNGRGADGSLLVHNGENIILGQGIRTIQYSNGNPSLVVKQKPPASTIVNVSGSPLLGSQEIGMMLAPEKPGLNDEFEIRIFLSETIGVNTLDFSFTYPAEFIEIVDVHPDIMFGSSGRLNFLDNPLKNVVDVYLEVDEEFVDWHMGTAVSIIAKMKKATKNILPMGFLLGEIKTIEETILLPFSQILIRGIPEISCFDLNKDNVVNENDFAILSKHMGSVTGQSLYERRMDFDLDGRVNYYDLCILAKNMTPES